MLVAQDLHIGYGSCEVARTVGDFAFAKANLTAIIGGNGMGKSTFLRALAYGNHKISGNVILDNKLRQNYSDVEWSRKVAVVLTQREFSHHLTVKELLELSRIPYSNFMARISEGDNEIIQKISTDFQISTLLDRRLHSLSDGQLQRVLIARALVQDTDFILMDEPTSHLDLNFKIDLLHQLKEVCLSNKKGIIFCTHELEMALHLANELVTIHKGSIVKHTRQELLSSNLLNEMFPSSKLYFDENGVSYKW
ncbi:ABC transporter ATP-binding protein [Nonlabens sp. SCSIO 43208]|uniref:ABC transporter ATP-binding protein n=1 Tax=Nonlabens sp. SCSIO 43208 TaxID=2793009 RepID=UPI003D6BAAB3